LATRETRQAFAYVPVPLALAGRRHRVVAVRAVLHADHDVGTGSEREAFEHVDGPRPVWLRDPEADNHSVALIDELERLEPAPLLIKVCEAANDLPAGASGRGLLHLSFVDGPPDGGAIEEADPGRELAASQGVISVSNQVMASCHQPQTLPAGGICTAVRQILRRGWSSPR